MTSQMGDGAAAYREVLGSPKWGGLGQEGVAQARTHPEGSGGVIAPRLREPSRSIPDGTPPGCSE